MSKFGLGVIAAICFAMGFAMTLAFTGCSVFESSCTKAQPILTHGTALLDDAQLALEQARDQIDKLPEPERAKALSVLDTAQTSLRASAKLLDAASTACSQPTVGELFAAFVDAWTALKPFLALLGGPGGQSIQDPIIYSMVHR